MTLCYCETGSLIVLYLLCENVQSFGLLENVEKDFICGFQRKNTRIILVIQSFSPLHFDISILPQRMSGMLDLTNHIVALVRDNACQ